MKINKFLIFLLIPNLLSGMNQPISFIIPDDLPIEDRDYISASVKLNDLIQLANFSDTYCQIYKDFCDFCLYENDITKETKLSLSQLELSSQTNVDSCAVNIIRYMNGFKLIDSSDMTQVQETASNNLKSKKRAS